jgi:hypothetical protein
MGQIQVTWSSLPQAGITSICGEGQPVYLEMWMEKDALVGIVETICNEYDVPVFSCRGYNSSSEQWSGAQRIRERISMLHYARQAVVLYFGDHHPSGLDMRREIREHLALFTDHAEVEVRPLALSRKQVNELALPPNPAKDRQSFCCLSSGTR